MSGRRVSLRIRSDGDPFMPLIAPQRRPDREPLTCRLDARLAQLLKCYAEFIRSRPDYIVNQALLVTFSRDREFQTWLGHVHPDDAMRIQDLVNEQPRGGARRAVDTTESPARE
jgi:hypothetical protein